MYNISKLQGYKLKRDNSSKNRDKILFENRGCIIVQNLQKNKNKMNNQIKPINLFYTLKANLTSNGIIRMQEEPSKGLFTYNVMFHNSNYTVYAGLWKLKSYIK